MDASKPDAFYVGGEFTIPESVFDIFSGALWEAGTIGLEYSDPDDRGMINVVAYFPRGTSPGSVMDRVIPWLKAAETLNISESSWNQIDEVDWNALWRSSYAPIEIDERLVVIPSWSRKRYADRLVVKIKPEMAFGTGSHETTRLCLEALLDSKVEGTDVADVGTGSGILAVVAARLGARHIDACDTDPEALPNAHYNARLNRVADRIDFYHGDVNVIPAEPRYRAIVANIVLEPLREALPDLAARLHPQGLLHLSGILEGQEAQLDAAIKASGLTLTQRKVKNEWVLLTLSHA